MSWFASILLSALVQTSPAQEWVQVAAGNDAIYFIHSDAIGRQEGWIYRVGLATESAQFRYHSALTTMMRYDRADCAERRLGTTERTDFFTVDEIPGPTGREEWSPLRTIPGSVGEALLEALCEPVEDQNRPEALTRREAMWFGIYTLSQDFPELFNKAPLPQ